VEVPQNVPITPQIETSDPKRISGGGSDIYPFVAGGYGRAQNMHQSGMWDTRPQDSVKSVEQFKVIIWHRRESLEMI